MPSSRASSRNPALLQSRQVVKNVPLIVLSATTFAALMVIVPKMTNVTRDRHETQIRIILRADIGATWHPGDVIDGHVQVTSAVQLTSMGTRVFFEGSARTWGPLDNSDTSNLKQTALIHKFLNQAQRLQIDTDSYEQKETGQFIFTNAFSFTIPRRLLPHDPTLNEQLLQLPPSLKVGNRITDRTGRTYMQPRISYVIRAVAEFRRRAAEPLLEVQDTREIKLIPFTEIWPPLATEDFHGEYTSTSTKSLVKTPFGGSFGEMSISMHEPSALMFTDVSGSACTLGYLSFELRREGVPANNTKPRSLTCTIHSAIHVKTFSSTVPLRGMPSYSMLKTEQQLRVQAYCIDLQTRKIDTHSWERESGQQPGGGPEPSIWATTLILPIWCPRRLSPTFCSTLAALRYALRVRLDIKGLYHSPFTLEVPLQVLYCREEENDRGDLIVDDHYNQQNVPNLSGVSGVLQHPRLETFPPAYDDYT